jgi:ribose transport system permease protein
MEQGVLILVLTVVLIALGAATTDGFLTTGNLETVLQLSLGFGILAAGQATVVLAKGVDLSSAAVATVTGLVTLELMQRGFSEPVAIATMVATGVVMGLVNGVLVAYAELPALFATLGTGSLYLGGATVWLLQSNLYAIKRDSLIARLTQVDVLGLRLYFLIGAAVFILGWLVWDYTTFGRMLRAVGDNPETARLDGQPDRLIMVAAYVFSSALGVLAGYILLSLYGSVLTAGSAFSPLLFTTLTAVVIGGISLSGGRGSILGVVAGTAFIAVLSNLLTLHSFSSASEDLTRGAVLLAAVILDAWLHPRDDETSKSEDL